MVSVVVVVAKTMDKVYRIANPQSLTHQLQMQKRTQTGTNVLCQEITGEVLKCPADSMDGAGYKALGDNLLAFKKTDCLPSSILSWIKKAKILKKPSEAIRPGGMTAVDCSIIKPNSNQLWSERHPRQKVLMLPRSTLISAQPKILMRQNNASSVPNLQKLQSHCTMLQPLVLMPVSENVPSNYKTKICWLSWVLVTSLHWKPNTMFGVGFPVPQSQASNLMSKKTAVPSIRA